MPEASFKSKASLQSSGVQKLAGSFLCEQDPADSISPIPPGHHQNPEEVTVASHFATGVPRHIWHGPIPGKLLEGANCWWPRGRPHFPHERMELGLPKPSWAGGLCRQSTGYYKAT